MNELIDQEPRFSKGYIAILATLPIWFQAISIGICLALAKGNSNLAWEYHAHIAWGLPFIFFHAILCMLDADRLQEKNVDLSYLWFLLPPLYLFLRGKRVAKAKGESLMRNQAFTLIWIISLIVATFSLGYIEEKYTDASSREIQVEPSSKVTEQSAAGVQQQGPNQDSNQAGQELIGKLISADQGDESCGLKIFGQDKKEIELSATFDLCDDDKFKVDKTYKFKFGVAEFPNCECQGNEECNSKCKKTIKRTVIVSGVLVN